MPGKKAPLDERFWAKVDKAGPGGCWLWTGSIQKRGGYGRIQRGGRGDGIVYAHVYAYESLVGPVPDGLELDHLCRVGACCNPQHLEPVAHRENVMRGAHPWATIHRSGRCARGHDRAEHGYARKDRPGCFNCRECRREDRRAAQALGSPAS